MTTDAPPPELALSLLGVPRLMLRGADISRQVKYRKAWALWALLGTTQGQSHARAFLAEWLWPDLTPPAAKTNLRQVIGNVRAVLVAAGLDHGLVCSAQAVGLASGSGLVVDVDRLQAWAKACAQSTSLQGWEALPVDAVLAPMVGTEFLQGWVLPLMPDGSDWLEQMRALCGDWALQLLEAKARRAESEGRVNDAMACARRLLALAPTQESYAVFLADLLQRQGQHSKATEVVRRSMRVIEEQLGVEPVVLADRIASDEGHPCAATRSVLSQEWRWVTALYAEMPVDAGLDEQAVAALMRVWEACAQRFSALVVPVPGLGWAAAFGFTDAGKEPSRSACHMAREWVERVHAHGVRCGLSDARLLVRSDLSLVQLAGETVKEAMRVCWKAPWGQCLATANVVQQAGEPGFVSIDGPGSSDLFCWEDRARGSAQGLPLWQAENPLVGRQVELDRLQACWQRTVHGETVSVLIRAPAGYGKTRLLQALAEREVAAGAAMGLLAVVCGWDIQEQSLMPWRLALKLDDEALQREGRQGMRREILAHLRRLATEGPLLVWLEDLHWADQATLDYLPILVEHLQGCRVMLVMTTRPLLDRRPLTFAEAVDLPGLAPDEAVQLLQLRADGAPYSDEERRHLIQSVGGVPLLLQWLARSPSALAHPGMQTLVQAQLDALGPGRVVLRAASVLGERFSLDMLQTLLPAHACQAVLVRAAELHLVRSLGGDDWAFQHALVQEVVYDSIAPEVREAWHAGAAGRLQNLDHTSPELLARHWQAARRWADAARCWRHAGDLAMERDFAADALTCYDKALDAIGQVAAQPAKQLKKAAIQIQVGHCLHMTEGFGSAAAWNLFSEVEDSLKAMPGDVPLVLDLAFAATAGRYMGSSSQGVVGGLDLAQRLSDAARTDEQRLMACYALGNTLFWLGRLNESRQALEEAVALSDRLSVHHRLLYCTDDPALVCRAFLSWLCWFEGDDTACARWTQETQRFLALEQRPHTVCFALTLLVCGRWCQGQWELVRSEAIQVQSLAQQFQFPLWEGVSSLLLICHQAQQEQLQNVDALHAAAQQMRGAYQAGMTTSRWMVASALMSQGMHHHARPLLEQACSEALQHEDQYCVPQMLWLLAECHETEAQPGLAAIVHKRACDGARAMGAKGLLRLWSEAAGGASEASV